MIIYLNKTSYQEFDTWLCNKAQKYKFHVSYDEIGLIDDLGELGQISKKDYPLRIFLSKVYPNGCSYDQDGVFIIEKVGERLKVCPKAYSRGVENLKPFLKEIADDWPETRERIYKEIFKSLRSNNNQEARMELIFDEILPYTPDNLHHLLSGYVESVMPMTGGDLKSALKNSFNDSFRVEGDSSVANIYFANNFVGMLTTIPINSLLTRVIIARNEYYVEHFHRMNLLCDFILATATENKPQNENDQPKTIELSDLEKACIAWAKRDGLTKDKADFLTDWYNHGGKYYSVYVFRRALVNSGNKGLIDKGSNGRWRAKN